MKTNTQTQSEQYEEERLVTRTENLKFDIEGDTATVANQENGKILVINAVGYKVLELCESAISPSTLNDALYNAYNGSVPMDDIAKDVNAFLISAEAKGIVQWKST